MNTVAAEQMASSSEEMARQAAHLKELIEYFKLDNNKKEKPTATKENESQLVLADLETEILNTNEPQYF